MNREELQAFKKWFKNRYPGYRVVLHPNYVREWKRMKSDRAADSRRVVIKSTKLKSEIRCPKCNNLANGATNCENQTPDPGSLVVCAYCLHLGKYITVPNMPNRLQIVSLTNQEIEELKEDEEVWQNIQFHIEIAKKALLAKQTKYN